jgi:hypothetical protein
LEAKILPDDIHRTNPFHAHPCHHLFTCLDADNQWFWGRSSGPCGSCWVGFLVRVLVLWQKSAVISPFLEPKTYQMTSLEPIHSMLIHATISWHVQIVIINGCGEVIWLMWVMLSQIRAWGGIKISCYLLNFGAKILPDDIHRANIIPCSSMPSSLDTSGWW